MKIRPHLVHLKKELGAQWLLVFYHNANDQYFFTKEQDFLFSNTKSAFSILGNITNDFKIDGRFEFLLQYPGIEGYNRWTQTIFPTDADETTTTEIGYNEIKCTWTYLIWGGLSRSADIGFTFVDGSKTGQYSWYSIGAMYAYGSSTTFAGPAPYPSKLGLFVSQVCLWMRILNADMFQSTYIQPFWFKSHHAFIFLLPLCIYVSI